MSLQYKDVCDAVLAAASEVACRPVDEIIVTHTFREDLSIDSLEFVQVITILEDKLTIRLPDEKVGKCKSVEELINITYAIAISGSDVNTSASVSA